MLTIDKTKQGKEKAVVDERQNRGWKKLPFKKVLTNNVKNQMLQRCKDGGRLRVLTTWWTLAAQVRECPPPNPCQFPKVRQALSVSWIMITKDSAFQESVWHLSPTSCDAGQGGNSCLTAPQSQGWTIHTLTAISEPHNLPDFPLSLYVFSYFADIFYCIYSHCFICILLIFWFLNLEDWFLILW